MSHLIWDTFDTGREARLFSSSMIAHKTLLPQNNLQVAHLLFAVCVFCFFGGIWGVGLGWTNSAKRTINLKAIRSITVSPHRDTMVAVNTHAGDTLLDLGQHSKVCLQIIATKYFLLFA